MDGDSCEIDDDATTIDADEWEKTDEGADGGRMRGAAPSRGVSRRDAVVLGGVGALLRARGRPACTAVFSGLGSVTGVGLARVAPVTATTELEYDGRLTTAYAFPVTLNVIALRGSTAPQWDKQFNQTMAGKGKVAVTMAVKPADVYEQLRVSSAPPGGASFGGPADVVAGGRLPSPGGDPNNPNAAAINAARAAEEIRASKTPTAKPKKPDPKYAAADIVSLGDEYLAPAIAAGLILPLGAAAASEWYRRLPPVWRRLVSRDPKTGSPVHSPVPPPAQASKGAALSAAPPPEASSAAAAAATTVGGSATAGGAAQLSPAVYGTPYRWGCTLIAYRVDKLPASMRANPPSDWCDLWRPEFKGKVAMGGGPRGLLTAALRCEGMSANAADWRGEGRGSLGTDAVRNRLVDLRRRQLLVQDDAQYIQALACGDAWIAVGPSDDILSLARRSSLVAVVVPASGTTLYADVWCVPASAARKPGGVSPLVQQWLDFTTQPARANLRIGLRGGVAPSVFDGRRVDYGAMRMDGPTGGFVRYGEPGTARGGGGGGVLDDILAKITGGGGGAEGGGGDIMKGGMPPDAVWERSEFLSPLSPRLRSQYNELIKEWSL